ncbi:IS21 family transposase [Dictyobacter formicarum]|uniref:Integrase catalytic domain-containing protein n=1 Tax=Dictyobacter formicarum TaxID=2778368 RepID=A0ABQ3VTG1_9CHLR|nr:IS21 family transposase [Dictyobacter formicarum]GHO88601.1 hypothetical protein KSZ_66070 [Dictyobacter formicarum]
MMLESPVRGKRARRVWREPVRKRSSNVTFAGWLPYGEAVVVLGGREVKVQVFVLRMCYSRKLYVQAFPTQRLECFLQGHMDAFAYFGGVPQRISYDNVATAVHVSHEGRERQREETRSFVGLRSHYLFEARFCTPFAPQEKGGVENGVGYMRERMFVPLPRVKSYEELNGLLRKRCDRENERKVRGEKRSIGEMWEEERGQLRAVPEGGYECAEIREARVMPYSQVIFETNRYSLPVKRGRERVTVKAYAFQVEMVEGVKVLARHERSYEREEDVLDPLHYVALIKQKPGSFEHALP